MDTRTGELFSKYCLNFYCRGMTPLVSPYQCLDTTPLETKYITAGLLLSQLVSVLLLEAHLAGYVAITKKSGHPALLRTVLDQADAHLAPIG